MIMHLYKFLAKAFFLIFFCGISANALFSQVPLVETVPSGIETNEPSIAIDPKYPNIQLIGTNVNFVFISTDFGQTWKKVQTNSHGGFYGDPVCKIDHRGWMYVAHLGQNTQKTWPEWFDRMVVDISKDEGQTWQSVTVGFRDGKMQDKPWLTIDETKKSAFKGQAYLAWTEFDKYGSKNSKDSSRIRLAYSDPACSNFVDTVWVSDEQGNCLDDDSTAEGATVAIGKKGEVFIAWARSGNIYFDKSTNGGKSFGKDQVIASQPGGWAQSFPGVMRANGLPFLVSDKKGILYLTWSDFTHGDADVWMIWSKDQGQTWSQRIRVNQDPIGNGKDQYMPHIAVDPKDNKVYILYYDRRNSENNLYTDVYLSEFKKGKFIRHTRLTNKSFFPPGDEVFFGDYISVAASKGNVSAAFTYVSDKSKLVSVAIALLDQKLLKALEGQVKSPYISADVQADSGKIFLHYSFEGVKSYTIKIKRAGQLYFQQVFDTPLSGDKEVVLKVKDFPAGVYEVELKSGVNVIRTEFFLERAKP